MPPITIYSFYCFTPLKHLHRLRLQTLTEMQVNDVLGTVLLATEGINGTIAGCHSGVDAVLAWLMEQPSLDGIVLNESRAETIPFKRAKVKIKQEIVTMGMDDIDPTEGGMHVAPDDWNMLIGADDVLLIDSRNEYEVNVGAFKNSIHPHTTTFREFPAFVDRHLDPNKHQKVALYCTGGIRCEKATTYLKQCGFEKIFQLKGGILNYLAKIPEAESKWSGECFVFDDRVTVDHQLRSGNYDQCHACRLPVSAADKQSEKYELGQSCPACHDRTSSSDKLRFGQREKQVALAAAFGVAHLGPQAMVNKEAG